MIRQLFGLVDPKELEGRVEDLEEGMFWIRNSMREQKALEHGANCNIDNSERVMRALSNRLNKTDEVLKTLTEDDKLLRDENCDLNDQLREMKKRILGCEKKLKKTEDELLKIKDRMRKERNPVGKKDSKRNKARPAKVFEAYTRDIYEAYIESLEQEVDL